MLVSDNCPCGPEVLARAAALAASGKRTVLLARADEVGPDFAPRGLQPAALVVITEAIRPEAAATLRRLRAQNVAVKVLSGDHPATVAAAATAAGLPAGSESVDATSLPQTGEVLSQAAERGTVFGRVTPEQKQAIVEALRANGHTVAMIGDGVNDVFALKAADLGIAMGGGSAAARAVAACVLVDGSFAGLPAVLDEGRRVIGNVEKLASLFFTKTVYALLLAISVSLAMLPFPFLPRQLTLISAFTIGIPAVFLTLSAGFEPARSAFLGRVVRFAVPAGSVAAAATFAAYAWAVSRPGISIAEERTLATIVMEVVGLWILIRLVWPLNRAKSALLISMVAGLCCALALNPVRRWFDLDLPSPTVVAAALGISAVAILCLEAVDRVLSARRGTNGTPNASTLALTSAHTPPDTGIEK